MGLTVWPNGFLAETGLCIHTVSTRDGEPFLCREAAYKSDLEPLDQFVRRKGCAARPAPGERSGNEVPEAVSERVMAISRRWQEWLPVAG